MIRDPIALVLVIAGTTAFGLWLERRFAWARLVGASLLIIALGALLSNLGLVAASSPVYGAVGGPVTSLAIVWLLLAVDLRDLRAAGPRMVAAFGVALAATCTGAVTATLLLGHAFPGDAWRLAGVMTGTYAGGSVNFVAVGREVGLDEALFSAAAAADNVLTAVWMGVTLVLPLWLARFFPERPRPPAPRGTESPTTGARTEKAESEEAEGDDPFLASSRLPRALGFLVLLTLGLGLLLAADTIALLVPAVPSVLWLTTLALAVGQLPAVRRLEGAFEMGLIALNLFFVTIGIGSRFAEIWKVGPEVFHFTAVVVAVHGLLLFGVGRLLRLDAETLAVASQAAVGGPSTAMALAAARGWRELALPGVMVGLLGYALGNYLGLIVAAWMRLGLGP